MSRCQHRSWAISDNLLDELIQKPLHCRRFGRTAADVNEGRQNVREKLATRGIQRQMCSDGEEIIPVANRRNLFRNISEKLEAINWTSAQFASKHERPLSWKDKDKYVTGLDPARDNLAFETEPTATPDDRDKLDPVGRRKSKRPRAASDQDAHFHTPSARQSQDVCERVVFHY
jgi:hypothetical protein